jgi:hypothetical protein
MEEFGHAYTISVGKYERKNSIGDLKCRREYNSKIPGYGLDG